MTDDRESWDVRFEQWVKRWVYEPIMVLMAGYGAALVVTLFFVFLRPSECGGEYGGAPMWEVSGWGWVAGTAAVLAAGGAVATIWYFRRRERLFKEWKASEAFRRWASLEGGPNFPQWCRERRRRYTLTTRKVN